MAIVAEPAARTSSLQVLLLTTGLPMFAFGFLAEVAILAICGMLMTLFGALIWARHRDIDPAPQSNGDRRWWRYPVNIPASLAASFGLNLSIALLWWLGSR